MDLLHSTNTAKDYNQTIKPLVKYFVDEYKRIKQEKESTNQNYIDMDKYLERSWKK